MSSAAEADLRGRIRDAHRGLSPIDIEQKEIADTLRAVVDLWYATHQREVDRLLQDVAAISAIQHERPDWLNLELLTAKLHQEVGPSQAEDHPRQVSPLIRLVGDSVLDALIRYDTTGSSTPARAKTATPSKQTSQKVRVATAALPVLYQIAELVEDHFHEKAVREDHEHRLRERQSALQHVLDQITALALTQWQQVVNSAKEAIRDATEKQAHLRDDLQTVVEQLEAAIDAGDALLSSSP